MTTKTRRRQDALDPAAVEALVRGDHGDPFALLGMHEARAAGSWCAPSSRAPAGSG